MGSRVIVNLIETHRKTLQRIKATRKPHFQDRVYFEVHIVDAEANSSCSVGCGKRPDSEELGKALGATPQSFGAKFGLGGKAPLQAPMNKYSEHGHF